MMMMTMMMITGVPASKMSMWKMTTTAMMISMVMIKRVIMMTMVMIRGLPASKMLTIMRTVMMLRGVRASKMLKMMLKMVMLLRGLPASV